jgi:hypothetical protein
MYADVISLDIANSETIVSENIKIKSVKMSGASFQSAP